MSEAPERIWAITEPNDISADILGEVYAQQIPDGMNGTPVEYVRADRIEELEAELLETQDRANAFATKEYYTEMRAERAEAKLAKAVKALTKAAEYHEDERTWWDIDRSKDIRTTLAELTGPDNAAPDWGHDKSDKGKSDKGEKGGHDD